MDVSVPKGNSRKDSRPMDAWITLYEWVYVMLYIYYVIFLSLWCVREDRLRQGLIKFFVKGLLLL